MNTPGQENLESQTAPSPELVFVHSRRAHNYRLTLRKDGVAVATVPARGTEPEARRFVEAHRDWLARARARQARKPRAAATWTVGTAVLWRGELTEIRRAGEGINSSEQNLPCHREPGSAGRGDPAGLLRRPAKAGLLAMTGLEISSQPTVCLAADVFRVNSFDGDLRAVLEAQFARRARIELPARTWELAAETGADVKHVTVRNQRSRWGSCSAGGTISLNWRLVQAPDSVRDYIIYHELMHLREMNHSDRYWAQVAAVCPWWRDAEKWLKRNGGLVGL